MHKKGYSFIKRTFDILLSFLLIVLLLPLLLIVSGIIKLTSKGPIFYIDERYGKDKKSIKVIKFRSMFYDERLVEEVFTPEQYKEYLKSFKLKDDPRITKWGKFMRKTSIDELPQLLNIFKGDMSFVGPRPIVKKEYEMLWNNNEEIFKVRPGLTGYWAIKGRSDIKNYQQRIELENYYINDRSIKLDLIIMFKTIFVLFKGR